MQKVRRPPVWSPASVGAVDRVVNTLEFFVHHEDIRRPGPQWEPRRLADSEQRQLWKAIGFAGRGLVRSAGVPVRIAWAGTDLQATLRKGESPVTMTGEPGELVLSLYGRDQVVGVRLEGPPGSVQKVRDADFGI